MFEAITGGQEDIGRAGDQIVGLEDAVDARFREEVAFTVGDQTG